MSTSPARLRALVLGLMVASATGARAIDLSGKWAVCLSGGAGPMCPTTLTATLVGAGETFSMTVGPPADCTLSGTVDSGTGAMSASGSCVAGGSFSGTATDASMTGTIVMADGFCPYGFEGVRECGTCADGVDCTTDGCGPTSCSAPSSTCTYAEATPQSLCSDGLTCTANDYCYGTTCMSGYLVNCPDNNPCTTDICMQDLGCTYTFNENPCNDHDACTTDDTCSQGQCIGGPALACDPCELCSTSVGCVAGPKTGCRTPVDPSKSRLLLRDDASDARDKLAWTWAGGQATTPADFGDPVTTDDYTLCVFDQTATAPRLLIRSAAPAASTCPYGAYGEPCWRALGTPPGNTGFGYRSSGLLLPDGLARVMLTPGAVGKAKTVVKGRGANLDMPSPLDVTMPVRVQLQAENGQCWEATYTSAQQDREDVFRAKGGN